MKKAIIFEDRVGFVEGPHMKNTTVSIKKKTGEVIEPLEEVEVNMSDSEWKELQEEKDVKKAEKKIKEKKIK